MTRQAASMRGFSPRHPERKQAEESATVGGRSARVAKGWHTRAGSPCWDNSLVAGPRASQPGATSQREGGGTASAKRFPRTWTRSRMSLHQTRRPSRERRIERLRSLLKRRRTDARYRLTDLVDEAPRFRSMCSTPRQVALACRPAAAGAGDVCTLLQCSSISSSTAWMQLMPSLMTNAAWPSERDRMEME